MENCIFCKIINKELPSTVIYEDVDTLAILNIHPDTKGHTLVIPREHHENFLVTPKALKEKLMHAVSETSDILQKQYSPTGMNITTNVGKSAGQIIFHTHIHIIPRYGNND